MICVIKIPLSPCPHSPWLLKLSAWSLLSRSLSIQMNVYYSFVFRLQRHCRVSLLTFKGLLSPFISSVLIFLFSSWLPPPESPRHMSQTHQNTDASYSLFPPSLSLCLLFFRLLLQTRFTTELKNAYVFIFCCLRNQWVMYDKKNAQLTLLYWLV